MLAFILSEKAKNCKKISKKIYMMVVISLLLVVWLEGSNAKDSIKKSQEYAKEIQIKDHKNEGKGQNERPSENAEQREKEKIPKPEKNVNPGGRGKKKTEGKRRNRRHKRHSPKNRKKKEIVQNPQSEKKGKSIFPQENRAKEKPENIEKKEKIPAGLIVTIAVVAIGIFVRLTASQEIQEAGNCMAMLAAALPLALVNMDSQSQQDDRPKSLAGVEDFLINQEILRKGCKISSEEKAVLYEKLTENPQKISKEVLASISKAEIKISISQVNRLRKKWRLAAPKGRPRKSEKKEEESRAIASSMQPSAGTKLFLQWAEENHKYDDSIKAIETGIENYKAAEPKEDFRLLHSKGETIEKKWKALSILSLLEIEQLSELDYHEHKLEQVLGEKYSYSTLTQFLGELERIDAGVLLNNALSGQAKGIYCYVDTHKIPYWSRKKMNKGKITSNGRIMAGSCAVIAQDQYGKTIAVEYHPADTHLKQVIKKYCAELGERTGMIIFIIDREVNSVEMANLFVDEGWELICLLSANDYKGFDDFKKHFCKELEDGTSLYKADWKELREDDPRKFVLAYEQEEKKLIVYWSTPKIAKKLTAEQIVDVYRKRTEVQENTFKHMKAHGALEVNYGRKTISGQDRSQQRKLEKIEKKLKRGKIRLQKINDNIEKQGRKIVHATEKNLQKLLNIRKNKLQQYLQKQKEIIAKIQDIEEKKKTLGEPKQRSDRDFRKQLIMTCRTAWLENQLKEFSALISKDLNKPIDIETLLALFFRRSAIVVETPNEFLYKFNSHGLSKKFRIILRQIIDGFNRISFVHQGKKVLLELV